jgi:cytochrome P450
MMILPFLRRPERWESIPEACSAVPGVWGNMLTFLGGPRACIGFRFSLIELVVSLNGLSK